VLKAEEQLVVWQPNITFSMHGKEMGNDLANMQSLRDSNYCAENGSQVTRFLN
jgi:hypothetical protein